MSEVIAGLSIAGIVLCSAIRMIVIMHIFEEYWP